MTRDLRLATRWGSVAVDRPHRRWHTHASDQCTSPQTLPSGGGRPRWTPDGRGIAYVGPQSNLWVQPLDGKPLRQLTHFADGRPIADFAWSRDGKRLAIARATLANDIVLFKGLRK